MPPACTTDLTDLTLPFVQCQAVQDQATGEWRELLISRAGPGEAEGGGRLLIVLDGNLAAIPAALMLQTQSARGHGCPSPCTVVGVGYPDAALYDRSRRARDFLPALPPGSDPSVCPSGQADAFSAFLDAQLLPCLEAQQAGGFTEVGLYGHSYGGLFVLHKLMRTPGRFDAFFSISPSIWWANGWLLDQMGGAVRRCAERALFLGIGSDERALPGDDAARQAMHGERDVQGRFARLVADLQAQEARFQAETFAGEDHGSVVYPSMARAVRWLLQPEPAPTIPTTRQACPT